MKITSTSILLLSLIFVAGCGGMRLTKEKDDRGKVRFTPEIYPLNIPEDMAVIPALYPMLAPDSAPRLLSPPAPQTTSRIDSATAPLELYRVQIFTSRTYGPAVREQSIASEIFDKRVALDYEVPYYKVRLGDFENRRQAEDYLSVAKDAGYDSAWVVRVTLNVQNLEPTYRSPDSESRYQLPSVPSETEVNNDSTSNPGY